MGVGAVGAAGAAMAGAALSVASPNDRFLDDWSQTQHAVEIRLMYVRWLADVNTKEQTFKAAIGFDMTWPATEEDVRLWQRSPETFVPGYVPNFEISNAKESVEERRLLENGNCFKVEEREDGHHNFLRTLVYMTCLERYELSNFPLDVQELTVELLMTFARSDRALFVPPASSFDPRGDQGADFAPAPMLILNRQFCALPEFSIRRVVAEFYSNGGPDSTIETRASRVALRFQVERRATGYLARVAYLCALLAVSALGVFSLDAVAELSDRLGFLITLVLASVAFQYVVSAELPQVAYLVLLEKFVIALFTSNIALLGAVALLSFVDDVELRDDLDDFLAVGYVAWLVLLQCAFVVYGCHVRRKERAKLTMGPREIKASGVTKEDTPLKLSGDGLLPEGKHDRSGTAYPYFSFESTA